LSGSSPGSAESLNEPAVSPREEHLPELILYAAVHVLGIVLRTHIVADRITECPGVTEGNCQPLIRVDSDSPPVGMAPVKDQVGRQGRRPTRQGSSTRKRRCDHPTRSKQPCSARFRVRAAES